jgi:hypothetical protein
MALLTFLTTLMLLPAFKKFGTPPSIVIAILTVETWLGAYTGKYSTINVLSKIKYPATLFSLRSYQSSIMQLEFNRHISS